MKYTIARQFSFTKEKFDVILNARTIGTVKASPSEEHDGRFDLKFSSGYSKYSPKDTWFVRPDATKSQSYLIYEKNGKTQQTSCFGQLSYELCSHHDYLYTIILGGKLYQVRSCDLKDRRLAIIDTPGPSYPRTLFQVIDSFSKSTKSYHVTTEDEQHAYGYLAIVILLNLHECQRSSMSG